MKGGSESFDVSTFLAGLTNSSGVYRMLDRRGEVIYVGKARNLKRRLESYFRSYEHLPRRTRALISRVHAIEITVTRNETEALILENNLIKTFSPRYNVLLRDDKSYPYIYINTHEPIPRLSFHRGSMKGKGSYFGPYPSASAVRKTLGLLQQLFQVRQCDDRFFKNRTRPCLQHQIKRCTAPCVGLVDEEAYRLDVAHAAMFLEGTSEIVVNNLMERMDAAAGRLEFERAARYRNQIAALKKIQQRQYVSGLRGNLDIVAARTGNGVAVVELFVIREGQNLGNRTFLPRHITGLTSGEILNAFLSQYYLQLVVRESVPPEILVSEAIPNQTPLEKALTIRAGKRVTIASRVRGERAQWLSMARKNAEIALVHQFPRRGDVRSRLEALREVLELAELPNRIECFDVSHTQGEGTVAACVAFGPEGPLKTSYRRYNIRGLTPGDDYAALAQALERRYANWHKDGAVLPDLIVVDGGRGQLSQATAVLEQLGVDKMTVIGVAKGPDRKAGHEKVFLAPTARALSLEVGSPALQLIRHIRDESHRFAISSHRSRRARLRRVSVLETIPGIGVQRRRRLLREFGGLQGIASADIEDLARVRGIGYELACSVYEVFHRID